MALDPVAWAAFTDLFPDNPEAVKEIVQIFLEESRRSEARMVEAIGSGDAATIHRVAHNLKSTSIQLGGAGLSETCRVLEAAGRSGDVAATAPLLPAFLRQLHTLQQDLAERLGL